MLIAKVIAIWYFLFISMSYLTSNTTAHFTSSDLEKDTIQAGVWDKSKLDFTKKGNDNLNEFSCPRSEFEISTVIKNVGETDMFETSTYQLFYVGNGEPPSEKGEKISEGMVPKLKKGEEATLQHTVTKEGFYEFQAFEMPGQNDEKVIWSEKIKVKCKTGKPVQEVEPITPETPAVTEPTTEPGAQTETNTSPETNTNVEQADSPTETNTQTEPPNPSETPQGETNTTTQPQETQTNTEQQIQTTTP